MASQGLAQYRAAAGQVGGQGGPVDAAAIQLGRDPALQGRKFRYCKAGQPQVEAAGCGAPLHQEHQQAFTTGHQSEGLQLGLLVVIQWPVGQALARRPVAHGLGLALACFAAGTVLLAFSALTRQGLWLVLLAQLPLALGEAAFLPIATEAVIELSPKEHQGLAMALFSQCFALSALGAPLLAGVALDAQRHAGGFWILMTLLCLAGLNLVKRLKPRPVVPAE